MISIVIYGLPGEALAPPAIAVTNETLREVLPMALVGIGNLRDGGPESILVHVVGDALSQAGGYPSRGITAVVEGDFTPGGMMGEGMYILRETISKALQRVLAAQGSVALPIQIVVNARKA